MFKQFIHWLSGTLYKDRKKQWAAIFVLGLCVAIPIAMIDLAGVFEVLLDQRIATKEDFLAFVFLVFLTFFCGYIVLSVLLEHAKIEETKTQIIHIVSHEIKSPLSTAQLALANVADEIMGPLTQKQKWGMELIRQNLERLNQVASNLLDIGRLESGKVEIHLAPVDLNLLITKTLNNLGPQIAARHLKATTDIAPNFPKAFADADMLVQVLNNLIGNALRYAKSQIRVRAAGKGGKEIQVSIEDDGPGIPKDRLGDLFQKFVQINRPIGGSHYKGTGLGLAIAKEIIRLNKGAIWAESQEGKGTQFYFTLPIA